ncbi:hypothetical protein P9272_02605 [Mesorhizobium sp. WSM4976]|jgi:hypothetical protein|uniref:hypothetical protein n=1 Tax=Mesorhizobium sp. WSM4976 TaxID=3038549 RepID=UPI0024180D5F|nr:hypothetical protein [Mesorhizobium sp. WSM4976]MDG4892487.1 hypothetical protein [Mesorhizobium sp. WSM4976]
MTLLMQRRVMVGFAVVVGLGIFAAANVHLVRTSFVSQPDCVPHLKTPGKNGQFRAAQSSC